jgi:hypothetical protein
MPNADLEPNKIEIIMSKIDGSIKEFRLPRSMDPHDPEVQSVIRAYLGPVMHKTEVDDVIRNLQAHSA